MGLIWSRVLANTLASAVCLTNLFQLFSSYIILYMFHFTNHNLIVPCHSTLHAVNVCHHILLYLFFGHSSIFKWIIHISINLSIKLMPLSFRFHNIAREKCATNVFSNKIWCTRTQVYLTTYKCRKERSTVLPPKNEVFPKFVKRMEN